MKKLKVLVACEESQTVCKAFRALGHEAYSNDIQDCSGGHPEWHLKMDAIEAINSQHWDLVIAHPPCTYLTVTGLRWLYADKTKTSPHPRFPNRKVQQAEAIDFFMQVVNSKCERIAIENPIGIMSSEYEKPTQIIRPFQFGHNASKKTCLWLKNLPALRHTNLVECDMVKTSTGKTFDRWYWETSKLKGAARQKERSKTFQGIADAMASQWSEYILSQV